MTKNQGPSPEDLPIEELRLAHEEFVRMLHQWDLRGANPLVVNIVFCTGLLSTVREYVGTEKYHYVVSKILASVEELANEEGATHNDRTRNFH